jgi:hypothetical protein
VSEPPPGAVVLGGDFNGLAIARSLGRRGVPVCVIDDERSIARASRYATHAVRVPPLRDDAGVVDAVLRISRRLGLEGCVVYPTRDEIVAVLSRRRTIVERQFVISTPTWDRVRWAWDKRNTYQRAADRGIPVPATWVPRDVRELARLPVSYPVTIKPAIKERFIYHTEAKPWRADNLAQLEAKFEQARALVGEGDVMVQEYIPGDGRHQFFLLLQAFAIARNHGRATPETASGGFQALVSTMIVGDSTAAVPSVVWSADMETGDLSQWRIGAGAYVPEQDSGACLRPLNGVTTQEAHSGAFSMEMTIDTRGGKAGCRQHRTVEIREGGTYYYSAWYFIPRPSWPRRSWNVFQFKSRSPAYSNPCCGSDPFWVIAISPSGRSRTSGRTLRLTLRWKAGVTDHTSGVAGPFSADGPHQHVFRQTSASVPVRKWFQIRVFLRQSSEFIGRIAV